jgi:hypothetical protein
LVHDEECKVATDALDPHIEPRPHAGVLFEAGDEMLTLTGRSIVWGDAPKALEWLETALRLRDSGLADMKNRRATLIRYAKHRVSRRSSGL